MNEVTYGTTCKICGKVFYSEIPNLEVCPECEGKDKPKKKKGDE